jgi:hypothetical protein
MGRIRLRDIFHRDDLELYGLKAGDFIGIELWKLKPGQIQKVKLQGARK